jgi:RNA polymerase sigma-70 factor, ECF subfamily
MEPAAGFESTLIAAQSGAEWALESLYRRVHPPLLRYLRAQEPCEAEDLASEAWLDVAHGIGRFEGDEPAFRRWAFTIARRRLIDLRRSRTRRRTAPAPIGLLAKQPSPTEQDLSQEAVSHLAALPHEQAEIVLLRVVAGFDSNEVALITGKKPGTVRVIQKRALERLAQLIEAAKREDVVTR